MACFPGKVIIIVCEIFLQRQKVIGNIPIVKLRSFDFRYAGGGIFNCSLVLLLLLLIYDCSPPLFLAARARARYVCRYFSCIKVSHQSLLRIYCFQKALVMLLMHAPYLVGQSGYFRVLTGPRQLVTLLHCQ